jgi:hypothetical protein
MEGLGILVFYEILKELEFPGGLKFVIPTLHDSSFWALLFEYVQFLGMLLFSFI